MRVCHCRGGNACAIRPAGFKFPSSAPPRKMADMDVQLACFLAKSVSKADVEQIDEPGHFTTRWGLVMMCQAMIDQLFRIRRFRGKPESYPTRPLARGGLEAKLPA